MLYFHGSYIMVLYRIMYIIATFRKEPQLHSIISHKQETEATVTAVSVSCFQGYFAIASYWEEIA